MQVGYYEIFFAYDNYVLRVSFDIFIFKCIEYTANDLSISCDL